MNPIPSMGLVVYLLVMNWVIFILRYVDGKYNIYIYIHVWLIAPSKKHKTIRLAAAMLLFSLQPSVVAM